jgi:hypothetical protein
LTGWSPRRSLRETLADVIEHERWLLCRTVSVPGGSP